MVKSRKYWIIILSLLISVAPGSVGLAAAEFDDPAYWTTYDPGDHGVGNDPDGYDDAVFDGRYIYFVPNSNGSGFHSEVLRYDTSGEFGNAASWATFDPAASGVGIDTGGYLGAVFDGRYVYFAPHYNGSFHSEVLRYDTLGDFTNASSWATFNAETNGIGNKGGYGGVVFDGRYVYFVPYKNCCPSNHTAGIHGEVLRYDTAGDFFQTSSWAKFEPGDHGVGNDPVGFYGAVFDGRYVYFVPYANDTGANGEVLRYDTIGEFTNVSSWAAFDAAVNGVGNEPEGFVGAVFDGQYVYFVPLHRMSGYHGEVLRYDTSGEFGNAASWATFDPGDHAVGYEPDGYAYADFDGRYVYFAPIHNESGLHGEVLRYDTAGDFFQTSSWATFDAGDHGVGNDPDGFYGAIFDGRYVYFVPHHNGTDYHGEVLRYDTLGNQPPAADPNGPYLGAAGSPIAVDGNGSSDPDGDPLTYDWDWGDGNTSLDAGSAPSHSYAGADIYNLCLTVEDDEGASDTACTYVVVYDPSAGFVTGGGWIDSPEGAYTPDPSLTGRAIFGFVSKYKKGADIPTGQTEFQFQVADLNFHSESYQWLVVTGSDYARFKGSGTINGMGDYRFMLWAGDGEPDTFRIRIWEEDELGLETDIYDNGFDQAIIGGSVVIHTKTK